MARAGAISALFARAGATADAQALLRDHDGLPPFKLLSKHVIGYTTRYVVILFLLSFGFLSCEHSSKALWIVAKKEGTIDVRTTSLAWPSLEIADAPSGRTSARI